VILAFELVIRITKCIS